MQILARGCAVLALLFLHIPCSAQAPEAQGATPRIVSARRANRYIFSVTVTESKDATKDVLIVVEVGDISLAAFEEQTSKKAASLRCGELDAPRVMSTTGGKKKTIILQLFSAPREARECTFAFGDHSLALKADAEVRDQIKFDEYMK